MAFKSSNLSVITFANAFTLYHYRTIGDTFAEVCELDYFEKVRTLSNTGDIVIINAKDRTGIKVMVLEDDHIKLVDLGDHYVS